MEIMKNAFFLKKKNLCFVRERACLAGTFFFAFWGDDVLYHGKSQPSNDISITSYHDFSERNLVTWSEAREGPD